MVADTGCARAVRNRIVAGFSCFQRSDHPRIAGTDESPGEVFLYHAHIAEYDFGNLNNHNPRRPRKLLLKRREINRIRGALEAQGKALIPLRLYITHGLVKVEIALCVGKKLYDKRHDLKKKVQMREIERAIKNR